MPLTALQSIVSRETEPQTPLVLSVGTIHGGTAFNIVADQVEMAGTVRVLAEGLREAVPESMERILKGVTDAHGGTHELIIGLCTHGFQRPGHVRVGAGKRPSRWWERIG